MSTVLFPDSLGGVLSPVEGGWASIWVFLDFEVLEHLSGLLVGSKDSVTTLALTALALALFLLFLLRFFTPSLLVRRREQADRKSATG